MIRLALGLFLFLQAAPAARTGIVAGQLKTVEGAAAVASRVSLIPAPAETVRPSFGGEYYYRQPPVTSALTDNQGRYRLINVPPGRYFLVSGITYHPTTLDADRATIVTVAAGSTTENLDFQLLRPLGGRVTGRVTPKPENTAGMKAILSGPDFDEILEVPVAADGSIEFGHVPKGAYLVDLVPPFPGMGSFRVQIGTTDVTDLELVRPATHAITGRIVVQNGPLPRAMLAFSTAKSYVNIPINPDLTFSARLHSARHLVELAGMPVGYSIVSVRAGSQDATQGLSVGNADVSNVVITVAAPRQLPHVRGQIAGLPNARLSSAKVQMTGPITGALETAVRPDGSFEFTAATPGMYRLTVAQVPEITPMNVVVTWNDADVKIAAPSR